MGQKTIFDPFSGNLTTTQSYTFSDSLVNTAGTVTLVNDNASPGASQYYGTNASSVLGYWPVTGGGGSTPGGSDGAIQYNASGAFGGFGDWDGTTFSVTGDGSFTGTIGASNFSGSSSGTNTGDVTLGTANGLSLTGQALSLGLSSTSTTGALSSTDWNTFNSKQSPLTFSDSLVNTGGTVTLVGDMPTPAVSSYYGTDNSAILGYHSLPVVPLISGLLSDTAIPGGQTKPRNIQVVGTIAYMTTFAGTDSILIYSVANVNAPPILLGQIATVASGLNAFKVVGNYLYGAGNNGYLYIYNISNPASPSLVSTTTYAGSAQYFDIDVDSTGTYAYTADTNTAGVLTWNVSVPTAPTVIAQVLPTNYTPVGVKVANNLMFITELNNSQLYIYNVSTETAPSLLSVTTVPYVFTVTSANATVGATYTNNGHTFTVVPGGTIVAGTNLWMTGTGIPTASGTLTKASGTGDATITFSAEAASTAGSLAISSTSNYAYITNYSGQAWCYIYQTSTPTAPILLGTIHTPTSLTDFTNTQAVTVYNDQYLYTGTTAGDAFIDIYNISVKSAPVIIQHIPTITGLKVGGIWVDPANVNFYVADRNNNSIDVYANDVASIATNNRTGSGTTFVMSASPTLTGTITAAAETLSGILTLSTMTAGSILFAGVGGQLPKIMLNFSGIILILDWVLVLIVLLHHYKLMIQQRKQPLIIVQQ